MSTNVSEDIINKALVTYIAKNTRYLTAAQISKKENDIFLKAEFSIKESCYLSPGSGHFNAIEALMCFNQMFYVTMLAGIEKKLFPFYEDITPDDFNQNRRSVYILELEKIKFKKQIDNNDFHGILEFKPLHRIKNRIYIDCRLGFGNDEACDSFSGNIKLFIPIIETKKTPA